MIGRARRRRHEEGAVAPAPARQRFEVSCGEEATTAGATGCACRSCAAVAVADCVALGCCPCAVLGLLGLALVRAPLTVARRLLSRRGKRVRDVAATPAPATATDGRVREKRAEKEIAGVESTRPNGEERAAATHHGRVREKGAEKEIAGVVGVESARPNGEERAAGSVDGHDAELAWLEEMYRTGRWGFGRVSFSAKTP